MPQRMLNRTRQQQEHVPNAGVLPLAQDVVGAIFLHVVVATVGTLVDLVDGIQVHTVERVSQSKSGNVWL